MKKSIPVSVMSLAEDYLAVRRSGGFALRMEEGQLRAFARFAEQTSAPTAITAELALAWAQSSRHGRQITAARRVELLRPFMRYCVSIGQAAEILPPHVCGLVIAVWYLISRPTSRSTICSAPQRTYCRREACDR